MSLEPRHITITLRSPVAALLGRHAKRLGRPAPILLRQLVEQILADNLIDAVLDEGALK